MSARISRRNFSLWTNDKGPRVSLHRNLSDKTVPQNHNDEYLDARGFQILDADYLGRSKERLDEQLQSIKTRISSTLQNYEQDVELCDEAEIEQVCKFHWASDIEAVEEYIKVSVVSLQLG